MSDPLSDMLIKIKNAGAVNKKTVSIPYSNIKYQLAKILLKEGFVEDIKKKPQSVLHPQGRIVIKLNYDDKGMHKIHQIRRVSKPGRRIYLKAQDLYMPKSGYGLLVVSTSQGLLTGKEARKRKIGGEAICEIW